MIATYFIMGLFGLLTVGLGALVGWGAFLLVGGACVSVLDAVLPDPNGVWSFWDEWMVWIQRAGAFVGAAIALGIWSEQDFNFRD